MMHFHDDNTQNLEMISIDLLVPKDHLARKVKNYIDFTFIYDIVKPYYSEYEGRPSVDPVILFKIVFIKYIFGIKSIRQTIKDIEVNAAYRYLLGLSFSEKVPHFTLVNTNYFRRYKDTDVFELIFSKILDQAIKKRMVNMEEIYIDSTHVKANANKKRFIEKEVEKEKKAYEDELMKAINEDRIAHHKEPFENIDKVETETKKVSTTDPESGYYVKGEKEKCFAYSAHIAVDNKGMVIGAKVTPGNIHDSQAFFPLYNDVMKKHGKKIKSVVMDVGYKTPTVSKKVIDDNKLPILPYKRPMTKKEFLKKNEFRYDKELDHFVCPNNQVLPYSTTGRDGYKTYKSDPNKCSTCKFLKQCTESKNKQKVITRHVWQESLEYAEELRVTEYHKVTYKKRKETVERCFGDGKENNTLRYTRHKGVKKNQNYLTLLFACMNVKKIALWSYNIDNKYTRISN